MIVRLVHLFQTDLATFERCMLDDELPAYLAAHCSRLQHVENLSLEDDGTTVRATTLYRARPRSYRVGPRRVSSEGEMLSHWTYNRSTRSGTFENLPDLPRLLRPLFENRGTMALHPEGGRIERVIEGELVVKVPVLGRIAEYVIRRAGEAIFHQEARAMASFIDSRRG